MIIKKQLNNGLTIVIDYDNNIQTCTMKYVVAAGSLDEAGYPRGIAHVAEHMLFQGTVTRTADDINKEIIKNGGYNNAYTNYSQTALFISCLANKWRENLQILNDMWWNSSISTTALEKEKSVIIEELRMYEDDPESRCMDQVEMYINKNFINRQSNVGTVETVKSITREDIIRFRKQWYCPNNCILIITGNVPINEVVTYINQLTSNLSSKNNIISRLNEYKGDILDNQFIAYKTKNLQQAHLVLYIKGVTPYDKLSFTQEIITYILGGHAASRLFNIIRDQRGLAYTITTDISWYRDTSYIVGYCIFDYNNLFKIKSLIIQQLNKLRHELINDNELELAKTAYLSSLLLDRESTESRTNIYESNFIFGTDYTVDDIIRQVNSITKNDILALAKRQFITKNIIWFAIIPE